jgi:hypothetical protein
MSTSAVSNSSLNQQIQQYFQTRRSDLQQLASSLGSGDLAGAQTAFNNIATLGQTGPFSSGNPFRLNQQEQDFTAIGTALQSGDLGAAQQAFANLKSTLQKGPVEDPPITTPILPAPSPSTSSTSTTGPEIVLNLTNTGSTSNPEQITININQTSGGGDQVALSYGPQGSTPQELTFNLAPNSNEQIVLNLLSASSAETGSTTNTSASTGLSVTA